MQVNELRIPATGDRRDLAFVAPDELLRIFPGLERLPYSSRIGARYAYVGHGEELLLGGYNLKGAALREGEVRFRLVALANDAKFPPALMLIAAQEQDVPPGFRQATPCWPEEGEPHGTA